MQTRHQVEGAAPDRPRSFEFSDRRLAPPANDNHRSRGRAGLTQFPAAMCREFDGAAAEPRGTRLVRLAPIGADAHVDHERDLEGVDLLHALAGDGHDRLDLGLRRLEHQLIVDLQQHPGLELGRL